MNMSQQQQEETIDIKISFTGVIDIKGVKDGSIIHIKKMSTVDDIYEQFEIKKHHRKYLISIINGEKKRSSYVLQENDHLSIFLPVGGG